MFSKDFAWGVADSAYQIEGRDPRDGCGRIVWDTFCEEGKEYEVLTLQFNIFTSEYCTAAFTLG